MTYHEEFLNYLEFERRSSSHTIKAYRKDLNQFSLFVNENFEEQCALRVDQKMIREWVVFLMKQGLEARTVNRKITTVRSLYKYLLKQGVVTSSPVDRISRLRVSRRLPVFVQEDDINRLLDNDFFPDTFNGIRDKAIIALLYGTGMRSFELRNLKLGDVNLVRREIKVAGKGQKERIIPYPQSVNVVLFGYLEKRNSLFGDIEGYFLLTQKGVQVYEKLLYRVVKKYLSLVATASGRSPHVIRHSYATHLLNNGADLNAVKELLGHASLQATQVYTHTTFEKLTEVYNQAHPRGSN